MTISELINKADKTSPTQYHLQRDLVSEIQHALMTDGAVRAADLLLASVREAVNHIHMTHKED